MRRALILALFTASAAAAQDLAQGDAAEGRELFATYCAACHGVEARGDGPMVPVLTMLPPDLTGLSQRNGGVFPVTKAVFQIDGRDPLLAHGADMPLFGEFFQGFDRAIRAETGQPILTSQPIVDLVAWLQEIQE